MKIKYSGKQITKAGKIFLKDNWIDDEKGLQESFDVITFWRSCHYKPLETAMNKLVQIFDQIDNKAIYAKRLKRHVSIALKLIRYKNNKMSMRNMHDIAGCRVVFSNKKKLDKAIRIIKQKSEFINKDTKNKQLNKVNNYIKRPKEDGYRSYHIIGLFADENDIKRKVEIQLRTKIQHYWATALEIVDIFEKKSLKFSQKDKVWSSFFKSTSSLFNEIEIITQYRNICDNFALQEFYKAIIINGLEQDLLNVQKSCRKNKVIKTFKGFSSSLNAFKNTSDESNDRNTGYILFEIDLDKEEFRKNTFKKSENETANTEYSIAEIKATGNSNIIIALVSTLELDNLSSAYPNYFADSKEFIKLLTLINTIRI